ncbi:toprim domain-containing protein [candidate division TA06 bacterium]|uniref:Toprim domain-containing protein n=1 Tax=candidate division TA06 bacterium TaxID=2250710 RepID=A0A523USC1_UNCT6|nr:MAG: toprim domain-containing protein [candidate division TA06 bacterium]
MSCKPFREEVARANDIAEVVRDYGVALKKVGNVLQGLCPFHPDKNPSLTVYPEKRNWHCFGCGAGGDVFGFVKKMEKCSFEEALRKLAAKTGITLPNSSTAQQQEHEEKRTQEGILLATAEFYSKNLPKDVREYLTNCRGLTCSTIDENLIGYAPPSASESGLLSFLRRQDFTTRQAVEAGVLREDSSEYFLGLVTFPNLCNGKVVYLTGRGYPEKSHRKPLKDRIPMNHLFNEDAVRHKEVVIVEGEIDTLILRQAGYNVCGILGTTSFKDTWVGKFETVEKVFIALDGDDAGKRATFRLGELLQDKARIVRFPSPAKSDGAKIKDWNELFMIAYQGNIELFKKAFQNLLDQAMTILDFMIKEIPAELRGERLFDALTPVCSYLARIDPIRANQFLRYTVKPRFHLTNRDEADYEKRVKELCRAEEEMKKERAQSKTEAELPRHEMSDEQKEETLTLLKDPRLLLRVEEDLSKIGVVGEERVKVLAYLIATSRKMGVGKGLAATFKAGSSSGKSHIVRAVASLMPEEEKEEFTNLSGKALYYFGEDYLKHKLVICTEITGKLEAEYAIRNLISEPEIVSAIPLKNEKTGHQRTQKFTVKGPISYLDTTTSTKLNPQNATRVFELYLDEGEQQTKAIKNLQAEEVGPNFFDICKERDQIRRAHRNVQRLLRADIIVLIPYAGLIGFPTRDRRTRRDFPKLLNLISVIAFLHQYQREIKERNGKRYIEATLFDYRLAYDLAQETFTETLDVLDRREREILARIEEGLRARQKEFDRPIDEIEFTRNDIGAWTDKHKNHLIPFLKDLERKEYLVVVEGGLGKRILYKYSRESTERDDKCFGFTGLTTPEELGERWKENIRTSHHV